MTQALDDAWARVAQAQPDLAKLLDSSVRVLAHAAQGACAIRDLSEDGACFRCLAAFHPDRQVLAALRAMLAATEDVAAGPWAPLIRDRRPVRLQAPWREPSSAVDAAQIAFLRRYEVRSVIAIPLLARDTLLGALVLWRFTEEPFTAEDEQLFCETALRIALAVDNERLFTNLQQEQRRNNQLLSTLEGLVGAAPTGLAVVDADLRFVHVNERLAAINGMPPHRHYGRTLREVVPRFADELEALHARVLATEEPLLDVDLEIPPDAPPGERRHFRASYYPVPVGGRSGVGAVVTETTGLVQAAERMRRLQAITAALAGAATPAQIADIALRQAVAAVGARTGIVVLSSDDGQSLEMLDSAGYPEEKLATMRRIPVTAGLPIAESVRIGAPIFVESLAAWHARYSPPWSPLEGSSAWAALPLHGERGQVGAFGLTFAVERRFLPEERAFMLTVAQLCAHALERARLFEAEGRARAAAEAANQAKDDFLAVLSHELRTPLTAILGWVQILRSRAADPALLERALKIVERNARNEAQLVDDILDVSRIVADKIRLELRPVDVCAVARAAAEVVAPAVEARHLTLTVGFDSPAEVLGDPARLQQIIANLLSNALKFTPKGGRIWLGATREGDHVRVVVRDSGEGIRADFLPHVFERFRQADSGTMRAHGGLGLGLTIARHLAELHGGSLVAHSEGPDRGATFTVSLPARKDHTEPALRGSDPGAWPRAIAPEPEARLRGLRVLVVDDEPEHAELLGEILRRHGAEALLAGSAREALAILEGERVHGMISDISMPHEDGYTLLDKARALAAARGRALPAIAVSAHSGSDDVARSQREGFAAHLVKPIDQGLLVDAVARWRG